MTTYSVDSLVALPKDKDDLNACLLSFGKESLNWDISYKTSFYNLLKVIF
jgi:hypothetical protein